MGTAVMDLERRYKYTTEISQMMFVFGEVRTPNKDVVRYIEDVVRSQVVEIVIQARGLAQRRNSRYISVEDLMFLIRHDKGKVNRLRTYLSWKDVRKKAKDSDNAQDANELEETLEDSIGGANDKDLKARKLNIKIPWDVTNVFTSNIDTDSDDEQDDDEKVAWEDSHRRLREADELTKKMTKDQYQYYSDCRQASFTYKKARRFKDFVQFSNLLEVQSVNDEVIDVLGFLCYEMVQVLCEAAFRYRKEAEEKKKIAIEVRKRRDEEGKQRQEEKIEEIAKKIKRKRARENGESGGESAGKRSKPNTPSANAATPGGTSSTPIATENTKSSIYKDPHPLNHDLPQGLFSGPPLATMPQPEAIDHPVPDGPTVPPNTEGNVTSDAQDESLFTPVSWEEPNTQDGSSQPEEPPEDMREPLQIEHFIGAFTKMQRDKSMGKMCAFRTFRGGLARTRVGLI